MQSIEPAAQGGELMDPALKAAAEQAVKSNLFGKINVWEAAAKISVGREIGISPMTAMGSLWIVSGRLVMSYPLLASLVQRSTRFRYRVLENSATKASIAFLERVGDAWEELGTSTFTIEMAKRANLTSKQPWVQYPEAMLFARALSQGVRMMCPSLTLMPAYVQGEIDNDDAPARSAPALDMNFGQTSAPVVSKADSLRATVKDVLETNQ